MITNDSRKKGSSIPTPFISLSSKWKQMISRMPAAIRKFPQTNVLGTSINITASSVKKPKAITPCLPTCHLPNISSISAFPESIAHPCLMPIYAANRMSIELIIFSTILLGLRYKNTLKFSKKQAAKDLGLCLMVSTFSFISHVFYL